MDVTSLVKECNKLGAPVDVIEVSKECVGWSPAQVLELRLEHLLLQRRLAKAEGRLKEMEGKVIRKNEEIENLKAQICKLMGRDSVGPAVQTVEEEDKKYETFDLGARGPVASLLGNEDPDNVTPSSKPDLLREESLIGHEDESQTDAGGGSGAMMENVTQSELEEDMEISSTDLIIVKVTSIGEGVHQTLKRSDNVDLEMKDENTPSTPNCISISEAQRSPMDTGGPVAPGNPQVKTSSLATDTTPRRQLTSPLEQLPSPDRPSSTLGNHCDSNMEVSSGEDEGTPPNSGGSIVAVVNIGKRFGCNHCPKTFSANQTLEMHRFRSHLNEAGVFPCDQCRRAFSSEWDLTRHNNRHHHSESAKTFKCKFCGKLFRTKAPCNKHQRMHDGISGDFKMVKCDLCPDKSYETYDGLNLHKKKFHPHLN